MFLGHFAVAFAAKTAAPRASLGALAAAAQLLDLIWPPLVLVGIEQVRIEPGNTAFTPLNFASYPFSHSLLFAAGWAALAGICYRFLTGYRRGALVIALAVLSHWVLDFISHRPDLPLYPGSSVFAGLGLWNTVAGSIIVESAMFAAGVWLYAGGTRSIDQIGKVGLRAYVAFLAAIYLANIAGPPPPNDRAVAIAALAVTLLAAWAWWIDRHRIFRECSNIGAGAPSWNSYN